MAGKKQTILLAGRNIEEYTLSLDDFTALADEKNRYWVDFPLDNSLSAVSNLSHSIDNFQKLKTDLEAAGSHVILAKGSDSRVKQFCFEKSGQRRCFRNVTADSYWQNPEFIPDKIVIDSSANYSKDDYYEIINFVKQSPEIRLIILSEIIPNDVDFSSVASQTIVVKLDVEESNVSQTIAKYLMHKPGLMIFATSSNLFVGDCARVYAQALENQTINLSNLILDTPDDDFVKGVLMQIVENQQVGQALPYLYSGSEDVRETLSEAMNLMLGDKKFLLDFTSSDIDESVIVNLMQTKDLENLVSAIGLRYYVDNLATKFIQLVNASQKIEELPGTEGEPVSVGLDKIDNLLLNKKISTWRWVVRFKRSDELPSDSAIIANFHMAGRFAKLVQTKGVLPVISLELFGKYDETLKQKLLSSLAEELKLMKVDQNLVVLELVGDFWQDDEFSCLDGFGGIISDKKLKCNRHLVRLSTNKFAEVLNQDMSNEDQKQEARTRFAEIINQLSLD